MIVASGLNLVRMLKNIGLRLVLLLAFDMVVACMYVFGGVTWVSLPDIPLTIFGSALGVVVGFRNNSSYGRWWEARMLWGSIVNNSRSVAREALTMIVTPDKDPAEQAEAEQVKRHIVILQIAYVHALRCLLRGLQPWDELRKLLSEEELVEFRQHSNPPVAIQQKMGALLETSFERGWLDTMRWTAIDRSLNALMDAQGGAERIKNTPLPKQYRAFPRLFVTCYCLLLPLAMVSHLRLFTPLGSTLVGFIFLALDEIGRDLEGPFDNTVHDVPLTSITRSIEITLKQLLGDSHVPAPEKPIDGVLW